MKTLCRFTSLLFALTVFVGCAGRSAPRTTFEPCHSVRIDSAPLWTASAAWTPGEDHVILIGPDSRSLLVYDLEGRLERRVELDPLADLDFASPMRLEATDDGYLLGDKRQILWLDSDLRKRRLWKPFEHLEPTGIAGGTLSDFAVVGHTVFAYADFVRFSEEEPAPAPKASDEAEPDPYAHQVPGADKAPEGDWFRGFARIDMDRPEMVSLYRFGLDDDEFNAYYFYDKRPYVMDQGKRAYVLRFSDPPQLLSASKRDRELRPFASLEVDEVSAIYAWDGRLYVLSSRREKPKAQEEEPSAPELLNEEAVRMARITAMHRQLSAPAQRILLEIDPKTGRSLRRYRLPTEGAQVKLLPGTDYWALIEESSALNMGEEDETRLKLLPSAWLRSERGADGVEVVLDCPAG